MATTAVEASALFQPTRPHGARPASWALAVAGLEVSTHAPARGATNCAGKKAHTLTGFNPRARTGRDLGQLDRALYTRVFQPTRPHGARPILSGSVVVPKDVSTHAPARGATPRWFQTRRKGPVSTHAPARGATTGSVTGDLPGNVSTHAPARGATAAGGGSARRQSTFQPTRPHGARHASMFSGCCVMKFQPTRPHGARHPAPGNAADGMQFQPTRPHGARPASAMALELTHAVSTHAPARGATCSPSSFAWTEAPFQPTRPHGARPASSSSASGVGWFQPTRPHGARRLCA